VELPVGFLVLKAVHVLYAKALGQGEPQLQVVCHRCQQVLDFVLEDLAKLLGGAVGASRAAVDSGWVPPAYQVGLTGKTITPDLYITIAISGASQHMAGCSGAKVIVAINKDPEANIFKEARYGVVGDWEKVLPALTETVRELTQS